MSILPILVAPDPRLKVISEPVREVDDNLRALMDDMRETMYDAPGIGLAAVQVGQPLCVIVMDLTPKDEEKKPLYLINPEISWASEDLVVFEEGCLSLPDYFEDVARPDKVKVTFLDYQGNPQEIECEGLEATCIQHEMDHLQGILFVDHISKLKRSMILRKLQKMKKQRGAD